MSKHPRTRGNQAKGGARPHPTRTAPARERIQAGTTIATTPGSSKIARRWRNVFTAPPYATTPFSAKVA
jgi:hypothetical protein